MAPQPVTPAAAGPPPPAPRTGGYNPLLKQSYNPLKRPGSGAGTYAPPMQPSGAAGASGGSASAPGVLAHLFPSTK